MNNKEKERIVFGYLRTEITGSITIKNDCFSIAIYESGMIRYITYELEIEKKKIQSYVAKQTINKIKKILMENESMIESFDRTINNGSTMGYKSIFILNGKYIEDYNIRYNNLDYIKKINFNYYKKYKDILEQENEIIEIFNQIVEVLGKDNIELSLENVKLR